MNEILTAIMNLSTLVFVVTGMLAMGLSLTIAQIVAPLRNARLVILALLANFVLVPALAYLIGLVIPLGDGLRVGLILVSTAAGAPFLPKLAQAARGNIALSVGLMVLLMVTTVLYMPLVLPLLIRGVTVDPWDIARSLIVLMLIPLAVTSFDVWKIRLKKNWKRLHQTIYLIAPLAVLHFALSKKGDIFRLQGEIVRPLVYGLVVLLLLLMRIPRVRKFFASFRTRHLLPFFRRIQRRIPANSVGTD
jgi:predicted Na+-dependent transporter